MMIRAGSITSRIIWFLRFPEIVLIEKRPLVGLQSRIKDPSAGFLMQIMK